MTATVAHLCALCRETIALDPGVYTTAQIDERIAAHHAVCPKRPIEVGDYVRWESQINPGRSWVEGEVVSIDDWLRISVDRAGPSIATAVGVIGGYGRTACRRIPRPAEAQAIELDCYVEWKPDGSNSRSAGQVVKMNGDAAIVRIREVSQTWTAFEACPFAGHARSIALSELRRIPWPHEATVDAGWLYDCMRCGRPESFGADSCVGCRASNWSPRYQDNYQAAFKRWNLALDVAPPVPPAPALVDGMDREWCLARWMENRLAVESRCAPPNVLTRMQVDVGRAMWLQRYGALRSDALCARVAAGREAERNRVRVTPEFDPWD